MFTVVGQIDKQSDQFVLNVASDVPNFTPFRAGTVLAEDGDYCYRVEHDEERIVFPNPKVKPGLRAGSCWSSIRRMGLMASLAGGDEIGAAYAV